MITIDYTGIDPDKIEKDLLAALADQVSELFEDIFIDLTAPPPTGTPVDTGAARLGWQLDDSVPLKPEIYNAVPYIDRLNEGHSQQSPAHFVEAIIDKHVR